MLRSPRLWNAPYLLLTVTALSWAGNSVVGRAVGETVPPVALAFWRWAIAAAIAVAVAPRLRADMAALWASRRIILLLSALGITAFAMLLYWGLHYTTAINSLLMQSAQPALILLAAFLLFGERTGPLRLAGVALALLGVLVIVSRGEPATLATFDLNLGDALVLFATLLYAVYTVLLRKSPAVHPLSFAAAAFTIGTVLNLPFYVAELASGARIAPTAGSALAIAYVALLPSFVGYIFYNRAVELIGAARVGAFLNLMPVFGAGMSMLFLGERLEGFHLAGVALIGLGILLASRKSA